jgi:catalase
MTLNRNVTDYHTEIEQAAFQPNNVVPGTGLSPDKMLLARGFAYADAHRARLGVNYQQIPVNRPRVPVRSYSKDGALRIENVTDPVYYPNSVETAPAADTDAYKETAVWAADGEMVRAAYTLHAEDDDYGQANTLLNQVMDQPQRDRLVDTVSGALSGIRREEILKRAFQYWRNIDKTTGDKIEATTQAKRGAGTSEKGGARFD